MDMCITFFEWWRGFWVFVGASIAALVRRFGSYQARGVELV